MYLHEIMEDKDENEHGMESENEAEKTDRPLQRFGYMEMTANRDNIFYAKRR